MNVRGKRILSVSTSVQTRKEVTVVPVTMVTDCVTTPTLVRVGEINHGIYETKQLYTQTCCVRA